MREEFEKLPEIAETIEKYEGYRVGDRYSTYDTSATAWLNGAWYAYQEQQKIIFKNNSINQCAESQLGQACVRWRELCEEKQKKIDTVLGYLEFWKDGNVAHNDIKDLLK